MSSVVWGGVRVAIRKPGAACGGHAGGRALTTVRSSPSSTQDVPGLREGEGSGARSQLGVGGAQAQGLTGGGCCQV